VTSLRNRRPARSQPVRCRRAGDRGQRAREGPFPRGRRPADPRRGRPSRAARELVAIRGRSGSGKSTLLHLLGGLDRPDAGRIALAGERVDGRRERELTVLRRRLVGFVFQFFHLIPELTGEENVLLAARLPGAGPAAVANARRLLGELSLEEAGGRLPHQLSGGEQQRFAIARALVNDPAIVLADEPTGNLDTASGQVVLALLRAIADAGRAVVIVTHEPAVTASADRVLQLVDGRLR
jgi:ABC-type lipoprotein export system ATPase subunit